MSKKPLLMAALAAIILALLPLVAVQSEAAGLPTTTMFIAADAANIRSAPSVNAPVVTRVYGGDFVLITGAVRGESVDGDSTWYVTKSGYYVSETVTYNLPSTKTVAFDGPQSARWIDVNVSTLTATAMQGNTPVYSAPVATGRPGFDTPIGTFRIQWRSIDRTMDSSTVGIPLDLPGSYMVPHVRYAMYFTNFGHAIHGNYWVSPGIFGNSRTSHGCVGMSNDDAKVLWDFASVGTKVVIHY
ncbi:MAG: L,D-transpeptidase [Chloroflexota bacterium]